MVWSIIGTAALMTMAMGALAAASAEVPGRIQTFSRSSWAEQSFARRGAWLYATGMVSLGCAAVSAALILL